MKGHESRVIWLVVSKWMRTSLLGLLILLMKHSMEDRRTRMSRNSQGWRSHRFAVCCNDDFSPDTGLYGTLDGPQEPFTFWSTLRKLVVLQGWSSRLIILLQCGFHCHNQSRTRRSSRLAGLHSRWLDSQVAWCASMNFTEAGPLSPLA